MSGKVPRYSGINLWIVMHVNISMDLYKVSIESYVEFFSWHIIVLSRIIQMKRMKDSLSLCSH